MDGWIDGWIDGSMDGSMDGSISHLFAQVFRHKYSQKAIQFDNKASAAVIVALTLEICKSVPSPLDLGQLSVALLSCSIVLTLLYCNAIFSLFFILYTVLYCYIA